MDQPRAANRDSNHHYRPGFLITIDTEGDNLWSGPRTITTENARFLDRFQRLCESYGFKPTYLTNYEMANSPDFQQFGKDLLKRNSGEIGTHPHAWNSPPLVELTDDDYAHLTYLYEYPENIMREKLTVLTDLLEQVFDRKMVSHRAGRWGLNETYAKILAEKGYLVDCSVTPHVSWSNMTGDPNGNGGPDFSGFRESAYFLDLDDISRCGDSALLEVPLSVGFSSHGMKTLVYRSLKPFQFGQRVFNRLFPTLLWLRPDGRNRDLMLGMVRKAIEEKKDYIEFMLHSSELMPGGSPRFPTERDIENLYNDLEALFEETSKIFKGATMEEYYKIFAKDRQ